MKALLVIPSDLKQGIDDLVRQDRHPTMDYYALASELRAQGAEVQFLDNRTVSGSRLPSDAALAVEAAKLARQYDVIFTNSESVSIPLSLLFRIAGRRPRHITIAHKLTTPKKQLFFKRLKVQNEIDAIFVYAAKQRQFGIDMLGIPSEKLELIAFHADSDFFRPDGATPVVAGQFCSAGLEWRDYPTLVETARLMPGSTFKIAAASPWSKHRNELSGQSLPPNVSAKSYDYNELRTLYRQSAATIVPLYQNDFQAGVTTILESMACGTPVVATRTIGQTDVIIEGVTGFYVLPGDAPSIAGQAGNMLSNHALRAKVGLNARDWLLEHASLKGWSKTIACRMLARERQTVSG